MLPVSSLIPALFIYTRMHSAPIKLLFWRQDVIILLIIHEQISFQRFYFPQFKPFKSLLTPFYCPWTTVLDTWSPSFHPFHLHHHVYLPNMKTKVMIQSKNLSLIPHYLQDNDIILILLIFKGIKSSPRVDSHQLLLPSALPCFLSPLYTYISYKHTLFLFL